MVTAEKCNAITMMMLTLMLSMPLIMKMIIIILLITDKIMKMMTITNDTIRIAFDNFRYGVRCMAPVGVWLPWTEVLMKTSRFGKDAHACEAAAQAWAGFGLAGLDPSAWKAWIPCLEIANIPQTMLAFVCCQRVKKPMCSLFLRHPKLILRCLSSRRLRTRSLILPATLHAKRGKEINPDLCRCLFAFRLAVPTAAEARFHPGEG